MSGKATVVASSHDAPLDSERRVSIWSVPVDFGPWFYLLLVTHTAPLVFLLWWAEESRSTHDNIADTIVYVASGSAPMIFVAAVTTIIELEVLVVLREWYRDRAAKKRAEERQKGREEGYKEGFEAGVQAAEREHQASAGNNSADKNGND